MGHVSPLCTQGPLCGKGLALERDGSVYACDHYVYPEYCAGNLLERPLADMAYSKQQEKFGMTKEGLLPEQCRRCDYLFACFGECPKNRFIKTPEGEAGLNYLCGGWKKFFTHIDEPVQKIVRDLGHPVVKEVRIHAAEHWQPNKKYDSEAEKTFSETRKTFYESNYENYAIDDNKGDGYHRLQIEAEWTELSADYADVVAMYAKAQCSGLPAGQGSAQRDREALSA